MSFSAYEEIWQFNQTIPRWEGEREKYKIKSGKLSANLFFIFTKCLYENDWVFGKWVEKVFLKKSRIAPRAQHTMQRRQSKDAWWTDFSYSSFQISLLGKSNEILHFSLKSIQFQCANTEIFTCASTLEDIFWWCVIFMNTSR